MKRILSSFLLVLALLTAFAFGGATPAHAGLFDLWGAITCVADIDCTVRAASTAALNYVGYVGVGKDFEELAYADIQSMVQGRWDKGLASAAGKISTLALSSPSPLGGAGNFFKSELSDNLLNTQVRAQTAGEFALLPIKAAWELMRNIAYGMFAVIMVAIGIMIILRKELSPRVVVTFTSALPKIVIGLVLIAFSYPLIAFAVDVFTVYLTAIINSILEAAVTSAWAGLPTLAAGVSGDLLSGMGGRIVGGLVTTLTYVEALGVGALSLLIFFIPLLLVDIAFLLVFCFKLLLAYGWILIYTVFSPIFVLVGSLPGQEEQISSFGKRILAKLLVVPAMLFFASFAIYFALTGVSPEAISGFGGTGVAGFLIGPVLTAALAPLLALIFLIMGIKAPAMIENALGVGAPPKKKK